MENFEDIKIKYLELVDFLIKYFPEKVKELEEIKANCSDDNVKSYISAYVDGVNKKKKYQTLLVDRNNSMFHKTGHEFYISVLPNLNIKKFLTSGDLYTKHMIWEYLQIIYLLAETHKKEKWHELLLFKIENTECPTPTVPHNPKKNDLIEDMIGDITGTLKSAMSNDNPQGGNPFELLMKTSMNIAEKYQGQLNGQDIDLNQIIRSMSKAFGQDENEVSEMINSNPLIQSLMNMSGGNPEDMIKGMSEKLGINPEEMMKNMEGSMKDGKLDISKMMGSLMSGGLGNALGGGLGGLGGLLGGNGEGNKNTEKLTDEQMKEMEDFFKNNSEEFEKFLNGKSIGKTSEKNIEK
jgi:hypothetical protein